MHTELKKMGFMLCKSSGTLACYVNFALTEGRERVWIKQLSWFLTSSDPLPQKMPIYSLSWFSADFFLIAVNLSIPVLYTHHIILTSKNWNVLICPKNDTIPLEQTLFADSKKGESSSCCLHCFRQPVHALFSIPFNLTKEHILCFSHARGFCFSFPHFYNQLLYIMLKRLGIGLVPICKLKYFSAI